MREREREKGRNTREGVKAMSKHRDVLTSKPREVLTFKLRSVLRLNTQVCLDYVYTCLYVTDTCRHPHTWLGDVDTRKCRRGHTNKHTTCDVRHGAWSMQAISRSCTRDGQVCVHVIPARARAREHEDTEIRGHTGQGGAARH